jgi:hypothetical protein
MRVQTPTLLSSSNLNHQNSSNFRNVVFRIPHVGHSPRRQWFWFSPATRTSPIPPQPERHLSTEIGISKTFLVTIMLLFYYKKLKLNSVASVRERKIPAERPSLVGEVIVNFCGKRVPRGQRDGFLRPYSRFSRQEPLLFYQVAPQLYSRGWADPVPDPLLFYLVVPEIETGPPDL